jgi:hypothetical protein
MNVEAIIFYILLIDAISANMMVRFGIVVCNSHASAGFRRPAGVYYLAPPVGSSVSPRRHAV